MFFKLRNTWRLLSKEDRICLLESGTVMMFFSVRAIPETTTASFAVDLLVMVAVYVYLETLTLDVAKRQFSSSAPLAFTAPSWARAIQSRPTSQVISRR